MKAKNRKMEKAKKGIGNSLSIIDVLKFFSVRELHSLQLVSQRFYRQLVPHAYPLDEITLWYPKKGLIMFADEAMYTIGDSKVPPESENQQFLDECIKKTKEDYPELEPGAIDPIRWRRLEDITLENIKWAPVNYWGKVI